MPILPLGQKPNPLTIGGSPRGWTFISSADCWKRFGLRYGVGLFPAGTKSYFDLGSAYHGLLEGQPVTKVGADYPDHLMEASRLYRIRIAKGPPLGKALAVEREYALFDGKMTSKPDREEPGLIRDYKTAMNFKESDEKRWNVAGGIIGEAVAAKVDTAIVDIISKYEGKGEDRAPEKPVKLVTVRVTAAKKDALEAHVDAFWEGVEERVKKAAKSVAGASRAFSPNLNQCVGEYGPCDYYDHCWGKAPESLMYRLAPNPPRRWVHGREDAPLKLPGKLTPELIEKAFTNLKTAWFGKK